MEQKTKRRLSNFEMDRRNRKTCKKEGIPHISHEKSFPSSYTSNISSHLDIFNQKPMKVVVRVKVPVDEHPKVFFNISVVVVAVN